MAENNHRSSRPASPVPPSVSASARRTLGPLTDLEQHLPREWWRTLFNSLYLKTDGDVVENDANTIADIDLLQNAVAPEPNDYILDLCCGQGRHCLELARRGFRHVTGVDRSRYLIRLARKRAKKLNLNVSFHEGDARRFRVPESTFHFVTMMGNSFGYFDRVEDDLEVLQAVRRALRSAGTLVIDITDGEWMKQHFEPRSWEWIDGDHFVCRERSLASDNQRLISREVIVHAERGVIADQFYAERLYTKDQISDLLSEAGFSDLRFHAAVQTESSRNQDLGMMAHRLFLSAKAPEKAAGRQRSKVRWPKVTVIMGDPRLPDSVKKDGVYNEEDHDAIQRLKRALDELDDYQFTFLDNHASLWQECRSNPPEFVFNLCDEGFNNDAFKELHIPAMLELFDIAYSGAGPGCLAFCYNKSHVRAVAESMDIPVPSESYYAPEHHVATLPSAFPAIVKPNTGDGSIGITKDGVVRSKEQLLGAIRRVQHDWPGRAILVQEFLTGPEYSVGIIGNPGLGMQALPLLEVDYSKLDKNLPRILGYESKWLPESPYWTQIQYREAEVSEDTRRELIDYSQKLFERLGCRDYGRFDFRCNADGEPKLLEANPNPGWVWDGKFNMMAGFAGMRYADTLRLIIEAAQQRLIEAQERITADNAAELVH